MIDFKCQEWIAKLFLFCFVFAFSTPENALARVQWVHEPVDLLDNTFCTRRFWCPELSFIQQTAPADPNALFYEQDQKKEQPSQIEIV